MLVVMTIMMIITTVLLFKQSRFDSSTVLRSLAYGVALSVRQAQVYGTSVVGTSTTQVACGSGSYNVATGNCYASAYGLYFSAANPTSYVIFADLNNDGQWSANETVKTFSLSTGYTISDFCAKESATGINDCWVGGPAPGLLGASASLTIMFKRPNPDACFATNLKTTTCSSGGSPFYSSAYIQLESNGDTANAKSVSVTVPGEVSVCATTGC